MHRGRIERVMQLSLGLPQGLWASGFLMTDVAANSGNTVMRRGMALPVSGLRICKRLRSCLAVCCGMWTREKSLWSSASSFLPSCETHRQVLLFTDDYMHGPLARSAARERKIAICSTWYFFLLHQGWCPLQDRFHDPSYPSLGNHHLESLHQSFQRAWLKTFMLIRVWE